jgi:V/A-type H+-transporting ATPase subunit E
MQSPPILELMSQQIASDIEAVRAAAQSQAESVKADARTRAAKRREEMLAAVQAEVAEQQRRSRERAEAETEMVVLTTKDTVTDEVLTRVKEELARVASSAEFPKVLNALLAELMQEAPADGVVLVPPAHEAHCREWLKSHGHEGLEVRGTREMVDGVAVQDRDQTFRITNTLSARFQQLEPALRKHCVSRLFGGEAS